MIAAVADTHVVIWYLAKSSRLSATAKSFMDNVNSKGDKIGISSITWVELIYLIEKGKIPAENLNKLIKAVENPRSVLVEVLLDIHVARSLALVSAKQVPDMPDRIIAATALHLGVPLISRDAKIQASDITTIW